LNIDHYLQKTGLKENRNLYLRNRKAIDLKTTHIEAVLKAF
jgi:hypothetical protein